MVQLSAFTPLPDRVVPVPTVASAALTRCRSVVEALTQSRLAFWADPDEAYVKRERNDPWEGESH